MTIQITVIGAPKSGTDTNYVCAFWLVAPPNNVQPLPNFKSVVPSSKIDAPTLAALQAGTLVEQQWSTGLLPSSSTLAQLKALAQAAYTAMQTALTATNPQIAIVGATFDGSVWATG